MTKWSGDQQTTLICSRKDSLAFPARLVSGRPALAVTVEIVSNQSFSLVLPLTEAPFLSPSGHDVAGHPLQDRSRSLFVCIVSPSLLALHLLIEAALIVPSFRLRKIENTLERHELSGVMDAGG